MKTRQWMYLCAGLFLLLPGTAARAHAVFDNGLIMAPNACLFEISCTTYDYTGQAGNMIDVYSYHYGSLLKYQTGTAAAVFGRIEFFALGADNTSVSEEDDWSVYLTPSQNYGTYSRTLSGQLKLPLDGIGTHAKTDRRDNAGVVTNVAVDDDHEVGQNIGP